MNTASDAADQVVRMSLNGAEVALKITGSGAKKASVLIAKAIKSAVSENKRTKGSIRLINLARSGKKLDVTEVADKDLKEFCKEAKKYGILYTILKDRDASDGRTEIMYKSEDKERMNKVFGKLGMATVDMAKVKEEAINELNEKKSPERTGPEKSDPDKFIEELLKKPNPTKEKSELQNPTQARTAKSNRSEHSSKNKSKASKQYYQADGGERRSVRKELADIKKEMERRAEKPKKTKTQSKTLEHKAPKKNKTKKLKER